MRLLLFQDLKQEADVWRVLGGILVEDIKTMVNTRKESESQEASL